MYRGPCWIQWHSQSRRLKFRCITGLAKMQGWGTSWTRWSRLRHGPLGGSPRRRSRFLSCWHCLWRTWWFVRGTVSTPDGMLGWNYSSYGRPLDGMTFKEFTLRTSTLGATESWRARSAGARLRVWERRWKWWSSSSARMLGSSRRSGWWLDGRSTGSCQRVQDWLTETTWSRSPLLASTVFGKQWWSTVMPWSWPERSCWSSELTSKWGRSQRGQRSRCWSLPTLRPFGQSILSVALLTRGCRWQEWRLRWGGWWEDGRPVRRKAISDMWKRLWRKPRRLWGACCLEDLRDSLRSLKIRSSRVCRNSCWIAEGLWRRWSANWIGWPCQQLGGAKRSKRVK